MTGGKIETKYTEIINLCHSIMGEKTLYENNRKYFGLIMNMPEVIWTTDCNGHTTFISPNVKEIFGYSPEEIYKDGDQLWFGRIHHDDVQKVKDAYKALFVEGRRFDIEYRIKRKDRKWIWLHDQSIVTYEKDGVMYADGIFSDISERKNIEEELKQSEQKFRVIFDNAADGILLADVKTKKFYVGNKMVCQMLGCKAEEIEGMAVFDIHPKEHLSYVIEQFERQAQGEATLAKDIPVKRKDGSVFYADVNSIPITLAGKKYLIGIFRDITERKQAEQALRESENKYRDLVEEMKDVIYTLDTEGNVTSINKAGKVTFGRETEEVLGKSFTKWIPEEQLPNTMAIFKRILRGEKVTAETVMLDKNGMPHNIEFSSTAIIKDGKVVGTRGIIRDITKRKKAEDELRKSRERIARAEQMASIGTLSASMVHKLTQPLMIITLSIERALAKLEKPSCTEAVKEVLKDAFSGVSRIVSIVSGFRDYGEKFPTKIAKEVNLKTIADRIVRLLSDSAHRARIILNINCLDKLPTIHAVEEDMEQLFFALTENAIQAADGKKKRHLVISGSLRDQHLELEFSDDCGGIALENLDRIFEPFFTTKPPGKGTGMGLCIVKDIVSRAGGQIRVESIPAKGSTFFVSLPINENKEG